MSGKVGDMDDYFLKFLIPQAEFTFQHGDSVCLIGSCFSDEISTKLKNTGNWVYSNPYGTVYHPSALAYQVLDCFNEEEETRIFERDNKFYSWNASTLISATSKEELKRKLFSIKTSFKEQLAKSKMLIVTFGTAWGYELIEDEFLVANCHKMPSQLFKKFLSSPYEIVQDWVMAIEKLQELNPELKIIFTVSPVRHVKDGVIENNLSKARLIEAVQQLAFEPNCSYFPSYELIIDVLRDYRFFKEDRVHPNQEAINFVWKKFETTYCTDQTIEMNRAVEKVNLMMQHRPSENRQDHLSKISSKRDELSKQNPKLFWENLD